MEIGKAITCALTLVALGSAVERAKAAETVIPITPPGGTDLSQALLPPPGLYSALVTIPYNEAQHYYDYNGKLVPIQQNLALQIPITAAAFAYVYPLDVFGGKLATSIVISFYDLGYQIGGGAVSGHQAGLADTYSDVAYWTKNVGLFGVTPGKAPLAYGLNIAAGLAMKLPTGV